RTTVMRMVVISGRVGIGGGAALRRRRRRELLARTQGLEADSRAMAAADSEKVRRVFDKGHPGTTGPCCDASGSSSAVVASGRLRSLVVTCSSLRSARA